MTASAYLLLPALMAGACDHAGLADTLPPAGEVSAFRWSKRLLIVEAPLHEARLQLFAKAWAEHNVLLGAEERHILLLWSPSGEGFRVRLVGKDGFEKHVWQGAVRPEEVFSMVDAMPMRRAEAGGRFSR